MLCSVLLCSVVLYYCDLVCVYGFVLLNGVVCCVDIGVLVFVLVSVLFVLDWLCCFGLCCVWLCCVLFCAFSVFVVSVFLRGCCCVLVRFVLLLLFCVVVF